SRTAVAISRVLGSPYSSALQLEPGQVAFHLQSPSAVSQPTARRSEIQSGLCLPPIISGRPKTPLHYSATGRATCHSVRQSSKSSKSMTTRQRQLLAGRVLRRQPLMLLLLLAGSDASLRVTDGPANLSVRIGGNASLTCRSNAGQQDGGGGPTGRVKVFWQRGGLIVAATSMPNTDGRYSIASGEPGVHDLRIAGVRLQDQGEYACQLALQSRAQSWPLISEPGYLRVLHNSAWLRLYRVTGPNSTDKPANSTVRVLAGQPLRLACVAGPASPAPAMSWTLRDETRIPVPLFQRPQLPASFQTPLNGFAVMTGLAEEGQLLSARSELSISSQSVTDAHHNMPIECSAHVPGFESEPALTAGTRLYVSVPPRVRVVLEPLRPGNQYREHDNVIAVCQAFGRPDNFTYSWTIDSLEPIIQQFGPRLPMLLTRRHDGRTVRCSATSFARGEAEVRLRVHYGPKFALNLPRLYAASPGGIASLDCRVESSPTASVEWRRVDRGDGDVLGRSTTLRLDPVGEADFGEYTCSASATGFPTVTRRVILARAAPPRVVSAGVPTAVAASATSSDGSGVNVDRRRYVVVAGQRSVRLECRVNSVPLPIEPDGVRWSRGDGTAVEPGLRRRLYREDFVGGTSAFLHFDEVQPSDSGEYNCTADNGLGTHSGVILLHVEENIPTAFIAGASIALLMVLIFVLVLVCVCRRSRWESANDSTKARKRNGCVVAGAQPGGPAVESPSKRLLQPGEDAADDVEASQTCTAGQPLLVDSYPFANETSSFIPASTCAVHGSLLRRHQQQQRNAPISSSMTTSWGPSGLELTDLSPGHRGVAVARFLTRQGPGSPSCQQTVAATGDEAPEEAGQEDSVRSCDSGYGGPVASCTGSSRCPTASGKASQLGYQQHHQTLAGAASSGGTAASDSGASSPGGHQTVLSLATCPVHSGSVTQAVGYAGACSTLLPLPQLRTAGVVKSVNFSPPLPPPPQQQNTFATLLANRRFRQQPAIAEDPGAVVAITEDADGTERISSHSSKRLNRSGLASKYEPNRRNRFACLKPNSRLASRRRNRSSGVPNRRLYLSGVPNRRLYLSGVPNRRLYLSGVPNRRLYLSGVPNRRLYLSGVPNRRLYLSGVPNRRLYLSGLPNRDRLTDQSLTAPLSVSAKPSSPRRGCPSESEAKTVIAKSSATRRRPAWPSETTLLRIGKTGED
uniref:Ig-like domain-containing protein n=1 Tax=Macrostomum lignano TaxID=282301 RepID=A0A1I8HML3_9PLAT